MKRGYDSDPAWSRTNNSNAKKKRKMISRASLRQLSCLIRKKRAADRNRKEKTRCVTRTVELPATQTIGDESNKLLFMLALDLCPNIEKKCQATPCVLIERLDPEVEAKAKARTKEVITQIFISRQEQQLRNQQALQIQYQQFQNALYKPTYRPSYPTPPPDDYNDDVECVDLVSSDEELDRDMSDTDIKPPVGTSKIAGAYRHGVHRTPSYQQLATMRNPPGHFKIITSSPRVRKPVFKSLGNNQESPIFSNWKPESMTRLLNFKEAVTVKSSLVAPLKGSRSKFISSLKSIPSTSTLTVRKFSTNSSPPGGTCKRHVHGTREDESSSSSVSELDYTLDGIITIDDD